MSLVGTGQGLSLIMNGSFEAATAALHIIKGIAWLAIDIPDFF